MILTKSIYDPVEKNDGTRILVMRKWPRGISWNSVFCWVKNLSPGEELLSDWKKGLITWEEYVSRFKNEMKSQNHNIRLLWERSRKGEVITLLCTEKEDDPHCHRHILKKMIEDVETHLT